MGVGKESLLEDQKVIIDVADIIIEDFLAQNAFSSYDFMCPVSKSIGMLKTIITLYDESQRAIAESPQDKKITWSFIKTTFAPVIQKVVEGNFLDPKMPDDNIK